MSMDKKTLEEMTADSIVHDVFGDLENPTSTIYQLLHGPQLYDRATTWKVINGQLKRRIERELKRV